ncbi:diphosphomevalonate decarboxylase [Candidatus Dojkabacteria bacterium]|uniref:diphosphomevalonate decarboxylase n=1 Tax=Candidatus Dojkabacteria bacterium TaxID=2099670 RepID=A0A955L9A2_9BACT|nr:diphosphomevalonate decarboxylase [Candidatus Dojkabacteria bacterium]
MKVTVQSPANIGLIKYWGKANNELFIPANTSISMTMSGCVTKTTVEVAPDLKEDSVEVKFFGDQYKVLGKSSIKERLIYDQIERIRSMAESSNCVRIMSENNFPADAGIASSASSFSAITAGLLIAYGLNEIYENKTELSKYIRLCGSGSAVRSVYGGFVAFQKGEGHEDSIAIQLANEDHWDLVDIVAVVDSEKKKVSSSRGHDLAASSPFYSVRMKEIEKRIVGLKEAIQDKDFESFGEIIETDHISMHCVTMTSKPPIFYWGPGTMRIIKDLQEWRENEGLLAYSTIDAGANVHVICQKRDAEEVQKRLEANEFVKWTIYNEVCEGVKQINKHLF